MQTDYTDMKPAFQGMLGDCEFNDKICRTASEAISFGIGVMEAADGTVSVPSLSSESFGGVSVHKQKSMPNGDVSTSYDSAEEVTVLRRGRIWVTSEQAVDPTDEVWLRCGDTYQGHVPGNFRTDDDGESEPICKQITNARWANVTTEAGLALLEINLP